MSLKTRLRLIGIRPEVAKLLTGGPVDLTPEQCDMLAEARNNAKLLGFKENEIDRRLDKNVSLFHFLSSGDKSIAELEDRPDIKALFDSLNKVDLRTLPNATEDEKTKISNLRTRYETKQRILDCIRRAPTPLQDQDKSDLSIAAKNGAAYGLSVDEIETAKTLLLNNFSALAKRLLDSKSLKGFREEEVETLSNLSDDDFWLFSKLQTDFDEMKHLRDLQNKKVKISNILKECKTSTAPIS